MTLKLKAEEIRQGPRWQHLAGTLILAFALAIAIVPQPAHAQIGEIAGVPRFYIPIGQTESFPWGIFNAGDTPLIFAAQVRLSPNFPPGTTPPIVSLSVTSGTIPPHEVMYVNIVVTMPLDQNDIGQSWSGGAAASEIVSYCGSAGGCIIAGVVKIFAIIGTEPTLVASPASEHVGATVSMTGTGFALVYVHYLGDGPIYSIYPERDLTFDGTPLPAVQANDSDYFTSSFVVPTLPAGTYPITATDPLGDKAEATFTVIPSISVTPISGLEASTITILGNGFASNSQATLAWDGKVAHIPYAPCSTDSQGLMSCSLRVLGLAPGQHTLSVSDSNGNAATASFTVTVR